MKARLKRLVQPAGSSFSVRRSDHYHAYNELHYHDEMEIVLVEEGTGILLLGDRVETIEVGNMYVIGARVPHLFRFETAAFVHPLLKQGPITKPVQLFTLHFSPDVLGSAFWSLPENAGLREFFQRAGQGIVVEGGHAATTANLLRQLAGAARAEGLMQLLGLFHALASVSGRLIHANLQLRAYNAADETRLSKIYMYTLGNFHRTITLKEVAELVYFVPNAFCRYFRSRTQQSYFDFLMQVRVRHACRLLHETDYSVMIISLECGFTNLSNFNRCFKMVTGLTPRQWRKGTQI